ncbi:hypothetical protein BDZ97DRAFT_2015969 [Flammula alnicola]|nr:hypothetical protein BDZ97DRAFT_2015969 [Flammula alnicola]
MMGMLGTSVRPSSPCCGRNKNVAGWVFGGSGHQLATVPAIVVVRLALYRLLDFRHPYPKSLQLDELMTVYALETQDAEGWHKQLGSLLLAKVLKEIRELGVVYDIEDQSLDLVERAEKGREKGLSSVSVLFTVKRILLRANTTASNKTRLSDGHKQKLSRPIAGSNENPSKAVEGGRTGSCQWAA